MVSNLAGPPAVTDSEVLAAAAAVVDPELPMLTIADLGILRDAAVVDGLPTITITPTYSGCPAVAEIARDIVRQVAAATGSEAVVRLAITPPWSSDWITPAGRHKLHEAGIAPPTGVAAATRSGPVSLALLTTRVEVPCPACGSHRTRRTADFGATACRSLHRCEDCLEPFEAVKAI